MYSKDILPSARNPLFAVELSGLFYTYKYLHQLGYIKTHIYKLLSCLQSSSILEHRYDTCPSLSHCRLNLVGWQREAIRASVTELIRVRVSSITSNICVISRTTCCRIQGRTAGANGVCSSGNRSDGRLGTCCQRTVLSVILGTSITIITILSSVSSFISWRSYWKDPQATKCIDHKS